MVNGLFTNFLVKKLKTTRFYSLLLQNEVRNYAIYFNEKIWNKIVLKKIILNFFNHLLPPKLLPHRVGVGHKIYNFGSTSRVDATHQVFKY